MLQMPQISIYVPTNEDPAATPLSVSEFKSRVPVGVEVMTGACVSMSLMKSLVILSNSSTSLILRGTPPPGTGTGPGGDGCAHKEGGPLPTLLFCRNSVNVK